MAERYRPNPEPRQPENGASSPTLEETAAAVLRGEEMIAERLKARRAKIPAGDPAMDTTRITI